MTRPWHRLPMGTVVRSPDLQVTGSLVDGLVRLAGYTHPLFTDDDYVRAHSPFPSRPLPGAALLNLMGGLAEQTGVLDGTVLALLGFRDVRFVAPALVGDVLTLEVELVECRPGPRPDRAELVLGWRAVRSDSSLVAEATARMLVEPPP